MDTSTSITLKVVRHTKLWACEAKAELVDCDGCIQTETNVGDGSTQLEAIIDALQRLALTTKITLSEIRSVSMDE